MTGYRATEYGGSDDERIAAAIADAEATPGHGLAVIDPHPDADAWTIERPMELPGNLTLVLAGATVRLAPGTTDTMLRNREMGVESIHVTGIGGARLDGTAAQQERDWDALHRNFGIHLAGVTDCSIDGLTIGPTNCWGLCLEAVTDARVRNVHFAQDGHTGNQDGVHVLGPARGVTISDISGTCGDDAVALSAPETAIYGRGDPGDIVGVTVENVAVRNVHSAGILRTIASRDHRLAGVTARNLALLGGTDVGDAAVKIGWYGKGVERPPRPADHRDISVDGLYVESWDGPVCLLQSPVGDLTIRDVRARHTGPFLYTLENDVDGLTIADCRSTLDGSPPETLVNEFHREILTEGQDLLVDALAVEGTVLEEPPGIIAVDHGTVRDLTVRDSRFRSTTPRTDGHPIWFRAYDTACLDSLRVDSVTVEGFATGVRFDAGVEVADASVRALRQRAVDRPWRGAFEAVTVEHCTPPIEPEG